MPNYNFRFHWQFHIQTIKIAIIYMMMVGWLCWGLTSQSTIFQSYRDGATASWVINQYFRGVKCLAQGHNTAAVGFEPPTSRSGVRHSTTEPPRSPYMMMLLMNRLNQTDSAVFTLLLYIRRISFQIIYRSQQLSLCHATALKGFPIHRYSVVIFTFSVDQQAKPIFCSRYAHSPFGSAPLPIL